jgi:hypothetical protein
MTEWIANIFGSSTAERDAIGAALIFIFAAVFVAYQYCQYYREENLKMRTCTTRLYRKFIDDFNRSFSGPS